MKLSKEDVGSVFLCRNGSEALIAAICAEIDTNWAAKDVIKTLETLL